VAEVTAQAAEPAARVLAFLRIFEDDAPEVPAVDSAVDTGALADQVFVTFEGALSWPVR
jgi:hypothetical protein